MLIQYTNINIALIYSRDGIDKIFCYMKSDIIFALGSSTLSGKPSTVAPETRISDNNNELSINNIGAVDDSELPTRYGRAAILPEEILYIEVFSLELAANATGFDLNTCIS